MVQERESKYGITMRQARILATLVIANGPITAETICDDAHIHPNELLPSAGRWNEEEHLATSQEKNRKFPSLVALGFVQAKRYQIDESGKTQTLYTITKSGRKKWMSLPKEAFVYKPRTNKQPSH